jgi:hypothetical protein
MSNRWTRRKFIERMAHVAGAITVGTTVGYSGTSALPQRTLGRTGVKISIIGLGRKLFACRGGECRDCRT